MANSASTNDARSPSDKPTAMDPLATTPEASPPQECQSKFQDSPERVTTHQSMSEVKSNKENCSAPPSWYGYRAMNNPRRSATKAFRGGEAADTLATQMTNCPSRQTDMIRVKRPGADLSDDEDRSKRLKRTSSISSSHAALDNIVVVPAIQKVIPDREMLESHPSVFGPDSDMRPVRLREGDQLYAAAMIDACRELCEVKTPTRGRRQAKRIMELLSVAAYATEAEVRFLNTAEATAQMSPNRFFNGPIVTTGQQTLPLQTVEDFLAEYYENNTKVSIQDPAARDGPNQPNVRQVTIDKVKERFARKDMCQDPWNLLELATHHDDGLRPSFLNNEDCRLLTKIKFPEAKNEAKRRTFPPGYKEVEKWALLAQAGALTEPHQDSHGYSTFITINAGYVGFGWLSHPTKDERRAWRKDPFNYIDGRWRYVVLKPGQTVYFPAGTVHFVFRLPAAGDSLAFGGHVLRCSNLVHWVKTILEEAHAPHTVNEDITESVPAFLHRVERFVLQAQKDGKVEKWGGDEGIREFLELKAECLSVIPTKKNAART